MRFFYENSSLLVLALAFFGIVLLLVRLWRSRRLPSKLEEDRSGFWRYHKETQFRRQQAYGKVLKDHSAPLPPGDKKAAVVLRFKGDLRAKEHTSFSASVDEVVINASRIAEVVICVNSPGGMVAPYGHVYSQMERIRAAGLPITVCVDVAAASGGYLMCLPANKIVCAPFALVGSIGVVAFVPNIRKFLLNHDVVPRTFTAGRYKRTVSLTDEDRPEDAALFQAQLETIHQMFRKAVAKYRTAVDIDRVSTGEHWTAAESIEKGLNLVDELRTSEDYLLQLNRHSDLLHISQKKNLWEDGLALFVEAAARQFESRLFRPLAPLA